MINSIKGFIKDYRDNKDKQFKISQHIDDSKNSAEEEEEEKIIDKKQKRILYLKLTILNHEKYIGKRIKLLEKGKLVWGIELERPQIGFPLEYRNIIVNSNDPKDFVLDINIPYEIEISESRFTTKEQILYDRRFNVSKDNEFFYSIRGNNINPKKIIFTFPGFGPSTTRISYSLSVFQNIDNAVTENALIIAFQDMYNVAGTYMIEDDFGNELYPKFVEFVNRIKTKYNLENKDLLFFGASKGGSIALMYMKDFKESTLLISAPQVELLYYWQSKAFFRNNLFHYFKNKIDGNLINLLNQYLNEDRIIHYFYTHNDELSNYNYIETINGFSNLHKYQIDGKHGEITKKAQTTIENIIINFVLDNKKNDIKKGFISKYIEENKKLYLQIVMNKNSNEFNNIENNKYILLDENGTRHYIYLTNHIRDNVAYSNEMQYIDLNLTSISSNDMKAIYFDKVGGYFEFDIETKNLEILSNHKLESNILKLDNSKELSYKVIDNDLTNDFNYIYFNNSESKLLNIKFVDDLPDNSDYTEKIIYIMDSKNINNINIFISRIIKKLKVNSLNIILEDKQFEYLFYLNKLDFPNITFELLDPDFDINNLIDNITRRDLEKFEKMYDLKKCTIKFVKNAPNQYFKNILE